MNAGIRIAVAASVFGGGVAAALLLGPAAGAGAASGSVTPTPDRGTEAQHAALTLARAIVDNPKWLRFARFSVLPPFGNPAAVSTRRIKDFPLTGKNFGLLSSGDATKITRPNNAPDTSSVNGGPAIRGARDVTILRISLRVPAKATCLSLRFRFLSEEFPEFVNDIYNDAFIAELDRSDWNASGTADPDDHRAPQLRDRLQGQPDSRQCDRQRQRDQGRCQGNHLRRWHAPAARVDPNHAGNHVLYLSIFDQGDRQYDSTVMLDHLTLDRRSPCKSGAVPG